jgi:hypothetical protein
MPFKPNYNQRRSERNRVKRQKGEEKQLRREEKAAVRKAVRDEPSDAAGDIAAPERLAARRSASSGDAFVLFDVVYEDGACVSNRRIAAAEIDPADGDASVRAVIEAQDRKFAELSGRPRGPIKSIMRSAAP